MAGGRCVEIVAEHDETEERDCQRRSVRERELEDMVEAEKQVEDH